MSTENPNTSASGNPEIPEEIRTMTTEEKLENALLRIQDLEDRILSTHVFSDKFWVRARAICGHNFAVILIVEAAFAVLMGFVAILALLLKH